MRLGCYGLNGGKAGTPFCVTVDALGNAHDLGGLVDGEPILAGQIVRVVTTGGGGWGDPLEREPEFVESDVVEGKVSLAAARDDYGVVLKADGSENDFSVHVEETRFLRAKLKSARASELPMINRGEGFEKMIRGEVKPWTRTG